MADRNVLICGAGIAGPTLAFWLQEAGFTVTLLERAPAPRTGGYVIDFWGLGYDIAERMGLIPELERIGYHVRELRIVNARGARSAGFGTTVFHELTGGRFVTLHRSDLARLLLDTLGHRTEVIFGDSIAALEDRGPDVAVRFAKGAERRFDLVIGADGLHSAVRDLLFGPPAQWERPLGFVVAAFEAHGYRPRDESVYVVHAIPGRQLARFATRDDRTLFLLIAAVDRPFVPLPAEAEQNAMLHDLFGGAKWEGPGILAALDRAGDLYVDRVSQIRLPAWSRGRVALTGDAAFAVSLMAGQGAALAMTAAYVLAGELKRANGRPEEAFAAYEARLRPFMARKQRAAEAFARAFTPRTQAGLVLRNLVVKGFAIPGLARLALGRATVDALSLPDYGLPDHSAAGTRAIAAAPPAAAANLQAGP